MSAHGSPQSLSSLMFSSHSQSKQNKPKSAAINKAETNGTTNNATRGRGRGRGGRARGRNAGRGKPKTADELDAEMNDYFDAPATTDAAATTNGATASAAAPAAAAGADAGMEDEIMVCLAKSASDMHDS